MENAQELDCLLGNNILLVGNNKQTTRTTTHYNVPSLPLNVCKIICAMQE